MSYCASQETKDRVNGLESQTKSITFARVSDSCLKKSSDIYTQFVLICHMTEQSNTTNGEHSREQQHGETTTLVVHDFHASVEHDAVST